MEQQSPVITPTTQASSPVEQPKRPQRTWVRVVIGVIILLIASVVCFYFLTNNKNATISGSIDFTALKPDPGDRGDIFIKYRKYGTSDVYQFTNAKPQLKNGAIWNWITAQSRQPYEVIAELVVDNKVVTDSEPLIVTAPAINQVLPLRVTWHDLPLSVVSEQEAHIKGLVTINGLIPPSSVITIFAKRLDEATFQSVAFLQNPKNENAWDWTGSKPLKDYVMKAELTNKNNIIGESDTLPATGGDSEINFIINSQTKPTIIPTPFPTPQTQVSTTIIPTVTPTPVPTKGKISGKIFINGPKDKNTSVLVLWRKPGQGEYSIVTRINYPEPTGQTWEWNDVSLDQQYEITTALQVNETNTASSRSEIVVAPAENVDFTLNSGVQIQTPSDTPKLQACTDTGNNQSDATIVYPKIEKAGNYWFQIGTSSGGNDAINTKQKADANQTEQRITVKVNKDKSYYASYAYSFCVNCSNDSNFSNFSNATRFWCGTDPNPGIDNKGYLCNTQNGLCEATKDTNAPYSYSNEGLAQCQKECRIQPTPR